MATAAGRDGVMTKAMRSLTKVGDRAATRGRKEEKKRKERRGRKRELGRRGERELCSGEVGLGRR